MPSVPLAAILRVVSFNKKKLNWEFEGGTAVVPNPIVVIPVINVSPTTCSCDVGFVVPIPMFGLSFTP
jgi:hypothetical protein